MREFHLKRNIHYRPSINLDKIWTLVSQQDRERAQKTPGQALQIDVTRLGYFKVLGKGQLPKVPIVIKAKFFSRKAEQRIKAAGGACVLTA
jgi:large subunit ribosomal protein L27Ae